MVNTTNLSGNFAASKDLPLPAYDPFDPEQNELLKLEPAENNPFLTLDRAIHFLKVVPPVIEACHQYIITQSALTWAQYRAFYTYLCEHPITLSEPVPVKPQERHDFSIKAIDVPQLYEPQLPSSQKKPVPA